MRLCCLLTWLASSVLVGQAPRRVIYANKNAIMQALFGLLFVAASACLSQAATVIAQEDVPTEQAIQLANRGNVDRAIQVLRDHLNKNAKDVRARVVLGRILDFDGQPDEAVKLWEKGLTGTVSDFPFLLAIGEIRHRQGSDGPTVSRRRGMVGAHPSKNEAEDERFKRSHLAQAATAFEKARKLRPDEPEAAMALASVYSAQKKHDAAAEVWKSLVEVEPKNAGYHLRLALAIKQASRFDDAAGHLTQAIELNPRLAEAHEALADIQKEKGQAAEAEESRKRAEFYQRLPSFCTVTYSEDNLKTLDNLNQEASIRKLADDPSEPAAEFLAALCWSHPHNQLETQAFEALEARGAKTTPLLHALLEAARSTCTIRSTAHILARRKADGLFEYLVNMLPGDLRGFAMDMDIAGSLDDLGDARAVGPLVQVLNPGDAKADPEDGPGGPLTDRNGARVRAALALGAFDTPEARRALEAGKRNPRIAACCLAALYRRSKDPKDLRALEAAVSPDEDYTTYVLGNYLRKKAGTKEAKELAQTWQQHREAQRAAEEAKAKQNAAPKAKDDPCGASVSMGGRG
jgi:tetratricopeptide (TPR) repeat protein